MAPSNAPDFWLDPSLPIDRVMTPPVTVPTGIGLRAALRELSDAGSDEVVVVDSNRRPLLVFAGDRVAAQWCPDRPLGARAAEPGEESDPQGWPMPIPTPSRVDEVSVPIRARVDAGSSIAQACARMAGAGCSRAAVVSSSGRLIGVVTWGGVLTWIASSARGRAAAHVGAANARLGA